MSFLQRERMALEQFFPGLDKALADILLDDLESPGSPGIELLRQAGGVGLVIPVEFKGKGASALDAVRVQRALGARSPSLAVASTMHHFSVSSLVLLAANGGKEWLLLEAVAANDMLVASGFAEGRPDGRILAPTMDATVVPEGVRVSGLKRPCSLARSMDLLTASLRLPAPDGSGDRLAVALIPAKDPGVTVSPFWSSFALAGAESDQVRIDNVLVPEALVVLTEVTDEGRLDSIQTAGFVWFELLMSASYLGAASALVEQLVDVDQVSETERLQLISRLEGAAAGIENIARQVPDSVTDSRLLVDTLLVRYAVQDAIAAVVPKAVELLGGLRFMTANDIGYLSAAVHGLGFHPPSRGRMAGPLTRYFAGSPLEIV
ncbi:acyl-CoA dehydrogenase family protein [Nocardia sp. CDC153]|uniref:acyl-CoA dehydrogenase family protein n=1 Tax=Nocardia sp. CDC153 TaxID=3112167 RepID=UPI002DB8933E|nr:acyl-CoA dehydrogenase family protein [Nocardia sp. CDC153]MEC3956857.1 acyl-CoA dehydrogenase family protein [Nocardia sp. CDC153]